MKKFIGLLTLAVMTSTVSAFGADDIKVIIDGKSITFEGQPPVVKDNRTLVPLRGILEALGAEVTWASETQTITAKKEDDSVVMKIGSKELVKNGEATQLDVAPELMEGSTMVPARAAAEAFGAEVTWDETAKTITIATTLPKKEDETTASKPDAQKKQQQDSFQTADKEQAKIQTVETSTKADDGTVVSIAKATYLEFANPKKSKAIDTINSTIKTAAETFVQKFQDENAEDAKEIYAEKNGVNFSPLSAELEYKVTYTKDTVVSILIRNFEDMGGAHPNTTLSSVLYNLETGKEMSIPEVSSYTQEEADKLMIDSFTKLIEENPDDFFHNSSDNFFLDSKDRVKKYLKEVGFYITAEGKLCFYLNPYVIAPYSTGLVSVEVDLNK